MPRSVFDKGGVDQPAMERLVKVGCAALGTPIGLLSIFGEEQTLFRAIVGLDLTRIESEVSVTRKLVAAGPGAIMVVEDGPNDPRVKDHPLVTGPEGLRFYAGATVSDGRGEAVGSIGFMDRAPRGPLSAEDEATLRSLAALAGELVDRAASARISHERVCTLELAEAMAGVGHFRLNAQSGQVAWSEQVYRIHGLEPGSVDPTLHSAVGAYHPEDKAIIQALVERALATGEGYDAQLRLYRADGEERVTRSRASCERDEDGAVTALFGVFQDVTDNVRAQERQLALLQSQQLAETVAGLGHWRRDLATQKSSWSDEVYRIYGVTRETFDPNVQDATAFFDEAEQVRIADWMQASLDARASAPLSLQLTRRDGEVRAITVQGVVEQDAQGQPTALFGVIQDVTEQERAHEAVARSEARYRLLADRATDVIAIYGLDTEFRYLSPAIEAVLGYAPEALVGRRTWEIIDPRDHATVKAGFEAYVAAGPDAPSPHIRYRAIRKDGGEVWLEAHPTLVRDAEGRPVEFQDTVRDISARVALERDLVEARDRAEAAATAKADFLSNMSHELRTPLTSVIGFSGLLKSSEGLSATQQRFADRIATASESLLAVINDILDYSKLEAEAVDLDPTPFEPRRLAEAAMAIVERQAEAKGLALSIETDAALPIALVGDEGRLRQVAINFLSNAVKFTETGSVRLTLGWRGGRIRVEVIDTGIGAAPDKIAGLFDRFSQADSSTTRLYGGTGLGLAISRRLIEMMGGEIGATSEPGRGSTFWFEAPLAVAEAGAAGAEGEVAPTGDAPGGLRLLVADDASANRELVAAMLGAFDIVLETAEDGVQALDAARSGRFDAILMDVHMPLMDGLDATREIRALEGPAGRVPIIALTANVQPEQVERCRAAGMDGHVGKPIRLQDLITAIAEATAGDARREAAA